MKRILFAVLALCAVLSASADPITREQAQQRAEQYLDGQGGSKRLSPVRNRAKLAPRRGLQFTSGDNELYYVFNRGENEGFVIATGDDATPPILGYTTEGEFDYANLPEGLKWMLSWYTEQLEDIAKNPALARKAAPLHAPVHAKVAPLCTSKWNQGSPYNDECPVFTNGERVVTGCVATAMAQVLYFNRAKSVTEIQKAMPGYTTNGIRVDGIAADSPIDWDNMLDSYGSGATAKQKKAVAQLMHYCGVAVEMMYNIGANGGSAAYSSKVPDAIKNYFGYGNSVKYISTSDPSSDSWDAQLYNELAAGRPVYLSGSNKDGGHAFVCDGYDGNQCFHINWGWGGSSDGYFMLSKLNPSSQGIGGSTGGYSDYPEAVIGIEPENYSTRSMPITNAVAKKICLEHFDADGDGVFTFGEAAAVTDLGDAFKGQRITVFNELYNFTNLTTLTESAFEGCTSLSSVKLPKHLKTIGKGAFKGCTALKNFVLPIGLTSIEDEAFDGCKGFTVSLPTSIQHIGANAFRGCAALTNVELPIGVKSIGESAFSGCSKLKEVVLRNIKPTDIKLGDNIFEGVDLATATLKVPQGTKTAISAAAQWKDFGTIYEMRDLSRGLYVQPTTEKRYYIYNVGTGRYLTRGEAWGTQAIVDATDSPMRFELKKSASMPEGVYYLNSEDTGNDSHILFRTTSDNNVGTGVRAAFVDGDGAKVSNKTAWWKLELVEGETNVYTIQIPTGVSDHKAAQYWGVNPDHASNAASPTYGVYSDVVLADFTDNCHWMFVEYDEQAQAVQASATVLSNLLAIADKKNVDATREQAVYDNLSSSVDEILTAQRRLRKKLGFINFENDAVRKAALSHACDFDGDGEITPSEASTLESFETDFYNNTELTTLHDLKYFTGIKYLAGNSFKDCTNLTEVTLPEGIINFYYRAFIGCSKLASIVIPSTVEYLGDDCFNGCEALKAVTVQVADPTVIELGEDVFFGVDLSGATLYVPYGSADLYREAPVWQDFGTIEEVRAPQQAGYSSLAENEDVYVYNVGLRRSITGGEAYGTQAVVGSKGFIYQLRRSKSMPEGTYYLYSDDTGKDSHVLFRTSSDSKVGDGVKTCFVDGTVGTTAYWKVAPVEGLTNVYTFQVPENQKDYTEGEFLGIDLNHASDYAGYEPTYGLYWDIMYDGNEENCQWAFISKAEADSLQNFFNQTVELKNLIAKANARSLDTAAEQAVYDNFDATEQEVSDAINSLRSKLHYIVFADQQAKTICTNAWDDDEDDELSLEEAAAVTDLGTTFRNATTITSLEELRHFTGLTELKDDAFRACSKLVSIYLPAGIKSVGSGTFATTTALRYMAVLNPSQEVDLSASNLTARNLTIFVPQSLVESYAGVEADAVSRQYGRSNPKLTYTVTGAPINGVPELAAEPELTSPVGDYPVVITAGTITSEGVQLRNGTLTVEPAQLTFSVKSYTRNIGEPNPEFEIVYPIFRNREQADDVLLSKPVCECDATADSPAGVYEIRIGGAEAQNYTFDYTFGTLTVVDPTGVRDLDSSDGKTEVFDLSGRRVVKPAQRGIYINRGKKIIK